MLLCLCLRLWVCERVPVWQSDRLTVCLCSRVSENDRVCEHAGVSEHARVCEGCEGSNDMCEFACVFVYLRVCASDSACWWIDLLLFCFFVALMVVGLLVCCCVLFGCAVLCWAVLLTVVLCAEGLWTHP